MIQTIHLVLHFGSRHFNLIVSLMLPPKNSTTRYPTSRGIAMPHHGESGKLGIIGGFEWLRDDTEEA